MRVATGAARNRRKKGRAASPANRTRPPNCASCEKATPQTRLGSARIEVLNRAMYSQRNRESQLTWDTTQICLNGHVINRRYESWPTSNSPHCPQCGVRTITQCPSCNTKIRGGYVGGMPSLTEEKTDPFCHQCGAAYPWTETSLIAARELIREIDRLNENEKGLLSRSLDDLVRETP
jgi:hypothetical protein